MRRPPRLSFTSALVRDISQPKKFQVVAGEGRIELRGALSAGSAGWALSANARWHRRIINVYITAREVEPASTPDLEDHDYAAELEVPPGWYHLRLNHVYIFADGRTTTSALSMFERSVRVM